MMTTPASIFFLTLGLLTYAIFASLAGLVLRRRGSRLKRRAAREPDATSLAVAAAANFAIGVVVVLEHTALAGRPLASLGTRLLPRDLVICVAASGLTFALAAGFARWSGGSARPSLVVPGAETRVALLACLTCGAWMEELLFRAFAFAWLRPHGIAIALLASAAVFTLVHVPTSRTDRWSLVNWLGGGVALGGIYVVTGSVWVATATHLARNVANVLWMEPSMQAPSAVSPPARGAYYAVLGSATFLVACALR